MPTIIPSIYCLLGTQVCIPMSEWAVVWQASGVFVTIVLGAFGLWKIFRELRRLNEQREKDNADSARAILLSRTQFFLDQHRRLFDNPELYEVLSLTDNDDLQLADVAMHDKKRKLLTFFEEIALLVQAKQISEEVAYYMFGYYAINARAGKNFAIGIDMQSVYWKMFFEFAEKAEGYLKNDKSSDTLQL